MEARFRRQLGLVEQARVQSLTIAVAGDNAALPYLLCQLVLLGAGRDSGGIYLQCDRAPVTEADLAGPIPFERAQIGQPYASACGAAIKRLDGNARLIDGEPPVDVDARLLACDGPPPSRHDGTMTIFAQVSATSIHVGFSPLAMDTPAAGILCPSLACLCAAVAIQEMLVRCQCVRGETIATGWVTVNLLLRGQAGAAIRKGQAHDASFFWSDGVKLRDIPDQNSPLYQMLEASDGVVRLPLPMDDPRVQALLDEVVITVPMEVSPPQPIAFSPLGPVEIRDGRLVAPTPLAAQSLEGKRIVVGGMGALGSWLTLLLCASHTRRCTLTLIDHDEKVERHNLNRQVLYREEDIGNAKVAAAAARIQQLNPANACRPICAKLMEGFLAAAQNEDFQEWDDFLAEPEFRPSPIPEIPRLARDPSRVIAGEIVRSDAVTGCLDNLKARYLLNVLCEAGGIPFLNAASQDFDAIAHRIDSRRADPCLICRVGEKARKSETSFRCQESGDIPIQSIVTSSAVAASLQTMLLLISLSQRRVEPGGTNFVAYNGRQNRFTWSASKPRWPEECPDHLLTGSYKNLDLRKSVR